MLIVVFRPMMSERYPVVIRLRPFVILKTVKMRTADFIANPLDSPKAVDRVTIAIPAAPINAHVSQRSQKLLVRMLSATVREPGK
jgi:hypothetical protein